jgi:hypothetical protein
MIAELVSCNDALVKGDFRENVLALQAQMQASPDQIECPVKHVFAPGCYAREMVIHKDILIIGKIHKHQHINIISKGSVLVATEFGSLQLDAPCTFVSEAGTKRAVYALEDTIWTTIHVTNETDLEKIEDYVIAKDYNELDTFLEELPA